MTAIDRPKEGLVEVWITKEGYIIFVLPVSEPVQPTVKGEPHHRTVMKMLWFNRLDHDWVISDHEGRLDHKIGEIDLLSILEQRIAEQ